MSTSYSCKCKKCGEVYYVFTGIGTLMPMGYRRTLDEIRQGVWGEEYKQTLADNPLMAVDVEEEVYICGTCGRWKNEKNMNLYAPNHPEEKTVAEKGCEPFVMRADLLENYRLVKRRVHYCDCGKRMRRATDSEARNLPCPHCGEVNTAKTPVLWD